MFTVGVVGGCNKRGKDSSKFMAAVAHFSLSFHCSTVHGNTHTVSAAK